MKLSIIVPVYNEEKTIGKILEIIKKTDYGIPFEILVINDGSTDNTIDELGKIKKTSKTKVFSYKKNKGKGYAIRFGFKKSSGDICVIQDADLEYKPENIRKLLKPIISGECKVVYGSRFLGKIEKMNIVQLFGNKFLTFMINFLFGSGLTDMETCYKVMHKDVLKKMNLECDGFEIEAEITSKILKSGFEIKELPIQYIARTKEEGKKIKWTDGVKSLKIMLKIKFGI